MSSFQCHRCGQWIGSLQVHEVGMGCYPQPNPYLPHPPRPYQPTPNAVICPVCHGSGVPAIRQPIGDQSVPIGPPRCHGCDGKGWVKV